MDILRKMFKGTTANNLEEQFPDGGSKNEFRKPQWFEEVETDDELFDDDRKFAFQIFTNPLEVQKHFERQLQQVLEALSEVEDVPFDKSLKDEFLKPGFENGGTLLREFEKHKKNIVDTDLDGEIVADELHSLIQRIPKQQQPNEPLPQVLPRNDSIARRAKTLKPQISDVQRILAMLHGIQSDEGAVKRQNAATRMRPDIMTPMTPTLPATPRPFGSAGGGVFEGAYQGPKLFSQSVMIKTVRKPDGSYETTKITQDAHGERVTTVTRTKDGVTEEVVKPPQEALQPNQADIAGQYEARNLYVTKEGYAMPRNLW